MAGQVRLPDGRTVSADQFRTMVQNNEIAAGPGGSAAQSALDSGTYQDPYANQSSHTNSSSNNNSGGSAATQAANNMAASGTNGVPAGARDENVYGLRDNDDPVSWARRVFAQGTADFGNKSLNPYLSQNPLANSPFARWYQGRYGLSAPTNSMVAAELSGQAPTGDYIKNQMQSAAGGNGLNGPNMAGAQANLQQLNQVLQKQAAGGGGLNPSQTLFAGQLLNDPQLASQIVTGQMQGATGGWGMGYLSNMLSNLASQYYNDPANRGPQSPNGSFLQQAMHMMGMA